VVESRILWCIELGTWSVGAGSFIRKMSVIECAEDGDSAPQQAPLLVCGGVWWCSGVFGTMYIHVSLSSSQPVGLIGGGLLVSWFA